MGGTTRVSKRCDRATVQLRKIFQRLRKIFIFERKNAQFTTVLPFWVIFQFFVGFWPILFAHFTRPGNTEKRDQQPYDAKGDI